MINSCVRNFKCIVLKCLLLDRLTTRQRFYFERYLREFPETWAKQGKISKILTKCKQNYRRPSKFIYRRLSGVFNKTYSTPVPVKFAISRKTLQNKENPSCFAKAIFYSKNKKHQKSSWLNSINFGKAVLNTPTSMFSKLF